MTAARAGEEALVLHEDRYFGPEPSVRRVARLLYDEVRALPLVSPHGHVDARRVDANWLAGLVARHVVDLGAAREMARALAVELAREAYKLGGYAGAAGPPR